MVRLFGNVRAGWLALGALVGTAAAVLVSHGPMHAVATDRQENFAMCTSPVDGDLEAVFFLDSLTGRLTGLVLNPTTGAFTARFSRDVFSDLQTDGSKNPKLLLVSGNGQLRGAGQAQFAAGLLYVTEISSGKIAAYGVPFNRAALNARQPIQAELVLLQVGALREAVVR